MDIKGINEFDLNNTSKYKAEAKETDEFKAALEKAYDQNDKEKLKEVCQQFESIFIQMMYKQMRATVPESELIEHSQATEMFEGMLDEELANVSAKRGIGIADMIYKQMSNKLEQTYKPTIKESEKPFDIKE